MIDINLWFIEDPNRILIVTAAIDMAIIAIAIALYYSLTQRRKER